MDEINKLSDLIQAYPRLFKGIQPRSHSQVRVGWYPLIHHLCRQIDALVTEEETQQFEVLQIKDKFGTLRFYFNSSDCLRPDIKNLVETAFQKSLETCDLCGGFRPVASFDTCNTLCPSCFKHPHQAIK